MGMDEPPITLTATPTATGDTASRPSPKPTPYARVRNMITGEELKIIPEDALLLSCTVEILNFNTLYQIAVIDEIQMIADPQRGSASSSKSSICVAKKPPYPSFRLY